MKSTYIVEYAMYSGTSSRQEFTSMTKALHFVADVVKAGYMARVFSSKAA
jgi:hypothetical protein